MKRCVIIGASTMSVAMREYIYEDDFIIAVDGGYENARKICVTPNLCLGDFDSTDMPKTEIETIKLPSEKDDTDMMFAAREAVLRGYDYIIMLGGTKGRFDHTFANIQVIQFLFNNGVYAMMADEENEITMMTDKEKIFAPRPDWYVSFFTLSEKTEGVTLENFKYTLKNETISCLFPIGISNEYRYTPAKVKIKQGSLLVIHSRKE